MLSTSNSWKSIKFPALTTFAGIGGNAEESTIGAGESGEVSSDKLLNFFVIALKSHMFLFAKELSSSVANNVQIYMYICAYTCSLKQ